MITPDIIKSIFKHKEQSKIVVFKDFCKDTPSWDEFIKYIDESSKVEDSVYSQGPNEYDKGLGAVCVGNIMIKQSFYYYMAVHDYLGQASIEIANQFSDAFKVSGGISSIYVNLSSNIDNIPSHNDPLDNFYWQCIGSTQWSCLNESFTVNPGDLVYIPAKAYHAVDFTMPRAAIGFSWAL